GVEHAHAGATAQVGEQFLQHALVLLLRELLAKLLALGGRELLPPRRLLQLALAQLRRQLEAIVQVARDAQLAGEDSADLVVGQLAGAGERVVFRARSKARTEPREQGVDLARL